MKRAPLFAASLAVAAASVVLAAPLATIGDAEVTEAELARPLMDAHGLDMLLALAQLEAARSEVEKAGLNVTEADLDRERDITVEFFASQIDGGADRPPEELLEQFLAQQGISAAKFDIVLDTNANLRKLIAADVDKELTDDVLRRAFNAQYGERVQVRHIALPNLEMVAEAQRRLAGGEAFGDVARDMSTFEQTARVGGDMPPFSRQQQNLPEGFKTVAFTLTEPGQVSDPVEADGSYHLIQFVDRLEPKAVKFEDVRAGLKEQLAEGFARVMMDRERARLQARVLETLEINDPELRRQFEEAKAQQTPQPMDRQDLENRFERMREQDSEGGRP